LVAGDTPERVAPAAGFAMKIAGAIHAAAPAAMPVETPLRSARRVMRSAGITRTWALWAADPLRAVGSLFISDSSFTLSSQAESPLIVPLTVIPLSTRFPRPVGLKPETILAKMLRG
jgi:hypothetical protein